MHTTIQECTWGIAYKVDPKDILEVMDYLNHREKGGYTTKELMFYPTPGQDMIPFITLVYIGTEANPMYLGPAPLKDIAEQVVCSQGPSGCNTQYVFELAQAMRKIAPAVDDQHLFSLEGQIKDMLGTGGKRGIELTKWDGFAVELGVEEKEWECACKRCGLLYL